METLATTSCSSCGTQLVRNIRRVNESKKRGWKAYCSSECFSKSRSRRTVLTCELCKQPFERLASAKAPHTYCSRSCAAKINNAKFPKKTRTVVAGKCSRKGCHNVVHRKNAKYCSQQCSSVDRRKYQADELLDLLKAKSIELRRVPSKREVKQLSDLCVKFSGSWNSAVAKAGLEPNRSHSERMYRRSLTQAKDGHWCDSISEAVIDNWLHVHEIAHERAYPYPEGRWTADWRLRLQKEEVYVEYFGLANDSPRYDRTIKTKGALCSKYGIKLIEIYPNDLYPTVRLDQLIGSCLP